MWTDILQILCLGCEAAAVLYLFGVMREHAGIHWHGAPSLMRLSGGLLLLMTASIVLRFVGYPITALIVAAIPIVLAMGICGFVLLACMSSSWK